MKRSYIAQHSCTVCSRHQLRLAQFIADITMANTSAAHFAHLRRLALTREVQQMAVKFVKYGSAAYFFRAYVMGVTAVNDRAHYCKSFDVVPWLTSDTLPMDFCMCLQCTGPSMFPTLNTRGDTPLLPFSLPVFNIKGDLILLEHFSVFAKTVKVGK